MYLSVGILMSSQQSSHLLTFLVLLSRYWHGPGAWYWQWNTSPQSLANDTPPPASWWQVTDPNPHLHMVTGTGSQSHTKWAGWLTLTLSVVTHCSSSNIYWYLSATWCTTTTTWTTTTTLAGYKYFNIKSARHIYLLCNCIITIYVYFLYLRFLINSN